MLVSAPFEYTTLFYPLYDVRPFGRFGIYSCAGEETPLTQNLLRVGKFGGIANHRETSAFTQNGHSDA